MNVKLGSRWTSVVCAIALAAASVFVPATPASATGSDAWPRGVRYCATTHPGHGTWPGFGAAIDMNAPNDFRTPLRAPSNGWVNVMTTSGDWGRSIHWMKADQSEKIHFAHLDALARTGRVEAGDLIGYVGSTGRSDGPHLHASARRDGPAELVLSGAAIVANGCYVSNGSKPWRAPKTSHRSTATERVRRGWTRGSFQVRLGCSDDWSGCAATVYRIDVGDARSYSKSVRIASEGKHVVAYRSRDRSGHRERWRDVDLKIDRTRPAVTLRSPIVYAASGETEFSATASDPFAGAPRARSGVHAVRFIVCPSVVGECRTHGGRLVDGVWRARTTIPLGVYTLQARAEDVAYNARSSRPITVTVPNIG
jgi:hypothetical protein